MGTTLATSGSACILLMSLPGGASSEKTMAMSYGPLPTEHVGVACGVPVVCGVSVAGTVVSVGVVLPQGPRSTTSSTYMEVSSPKPSWCTRNSIRTVCPAYGVMSNVLFVQADVFSHTCMMVA